MRIRIAYLMLVLGLIVMMFLAHGQAGEMDREGLLWFRDSSLGLKGPEWLTVIVRDVTALGSNWLLLYAMSTLTIVFLARRRLSEAVQVLLLSCGGVLLSMGAKYVFDRPRPDLVPHLIEVYTPSFPSGHATMSMVCLLGGALLVSPQWQVKARRVLVLSGLLMAILVGVSRVMLGVHWPSDVMAGWLLGILWVMMVDQYCSHRRGEVSSMIRLFKT